MKPLNPALFAALAALAAAALTAAMSPAMSPGMSPGMSPARMRAGPAVQPAQSAEPPRVSRCLAVAENGVKAIPAAADTPVSAGAQIAQLRGHQVKISFITHSTFMIESAAGIRIATDFAGVWGDGPPPDVATMNHAHSTHYTDAPDPGIAHVLRGWREGGYAEHDLQVGDVHIRNVPTNTRNWGRIGTELFGNSIFIFEVAGLCIGHLGHLHHELTDQQLGQIGLLDVVMVPVDGTYTLEVDAMIRVLADLKTRAILPMHVFGQWSLDRFLDRLRPHFAVRTAPSGTVVLSQGTLPLKPEVLVLVNGDERLPGGRRTP